MMKEWIRSGGRWLAGGMTIAAGIALLWRAHAFEDPVGAGMTVPAMCVVTAMVLALTGLVTLSTREDPDYPF